MKNDTSAIWKEYSSRLYSFIISRVNNPADAEDILQEVFIKAHNSLSSLKNEHKLQSWLFTIARNLINDHYRKSQPFPGSGLTGDTFIVREDDGIMACVRPLIKELPENYRTAVEFCDLEGHTQQQLADREGISLPGAKSRLQRARAKLKQLFFACCHIETDKYGNIVEHFPKRDCACV